MARTSPSVARRAVPRGAPFLNGPVSVPARWGPNYPTAGHTENVVVRGTPGKAVAGLVIGVLAIPGMIIPLLGDRARRARTGLGLSARSQIRREGLTGSGQALAGVILGSIAIVLSVAIIIAAVASA